MRTSGGGAAVTCSTCPEAGQPVLCGGAALGHDAGTLQSLRGVGTGGVQGGSRWAGLPQSLRGGRDGVSQAAGSRGFLKKLSLLSMIYMSGRTGLN